MSESSRGSFFQLKSAQSVVNLVADNFVIFLSRLTGCAAAGIGEHCRDNERVDGSNIEKRSLVAGI